MIVECADDMVVGSITALDYALEGTELDNVVLTNTRLTV